jgi:hypothetical protein
VQPDARSVERHADLNRSGALVASGASARVDGSWLRRGQRWFHGRFVIGLPAEEADAPPTEHPVLGSDFWYLFTERTGAPVACDLAVMPAVPPVSPSRLSPEQALETVGAALEREDRGDIELEVCDPGLHPELGLMYPVISSSSWATGEPTQVRWWVDAATGEIRRREPFAQHAVSGVLRGPAVPTRGGAARRALSAANLPSIEPAQGWPLVGREGGGSANFTRTDAGGNFRFDFVLDGLWGIETLVASPDFCWHGIPGDQLARSRAAGIGRNISIEMMLEASAGNALDLAGQISMWNIADTCRSWSLGIRRRLDLLPALLQPQEHLVARDPAVYHLQLWRFRSPPGVQTIIGAYSDTPWPPRMGTSTGNDLVNDGSIATWHEYGHYEMLSLTGLRHLGGWPLAHHPASGEAWADAFMDYALARVDPAGEDNGWIGWGRDVGHEEECFHRDIALGRVMLRRGADGHAAIEGGHAQWPNDDAEIHAQGLPVSGSFWLLRQLLVERYGVAAGLDRAEELLFCWVGSHAGGQVPRFTPQSVIRILLADDAEGSGGDDNFQNGTPSSREVKLAFAAHNLYFFDFVRGDANADGRVDLGDAIFTLSHLFLGDREPSCLDAADADDSGAVDLSDAVVTLGSLFLAAVDLPPPTTCGPDPTFLDRLPCNLQPPACGEIR